MADRGHGLAGVEERLDQRQRILVGAQQIRVDLPARQHDGVVIGGLRRTQRLVDLHRPAPILLVPALDLALFWRGDVDLGARRLERVARLFQFRLLEAVGGDDEDAFSVQWSFARLSWHVVSPCL